MAVALWLYPGCRPWRCVIVSAPSISNMATVNKKRKVDCEGRRFQDSWKLDYFFTEIRNNCVCLICQENVAVFKEFNIKRHYQTKHASYDKLTGNGRGEKVKQLEAVLTAQQRFFTRARESNENATKARSYEVAMLIAKHCKPFTEGEFIKDCVITIVKKVCPSKKQEFANICLARNTVVWRIEDVSSDIKRQLEAKGTEFDFFSLACDESTDASDTAQLLIFLRGVDNDMNVSEELLDLQSLKGQTRGTDLFVSLCSTVDEMKLQWNKVTGIISDGAPAMAGKQSGLSTLVCNKVSEEGGSAIKLHCFILQEVLCAKYMKYDNVMKPVIKAINYICSKTLCHRQFQQFLLDIQAEYEDVLYHSDVRWLSRGSALQHFFSLREEIGQFLTKKGQPMPQLNDPVWLADLGFLVDIMRHLNALNTSLQGQNAVVSQLYSHIKAFQTKLLLFQRHLSQAQPNTAHFSSLQEIMTSFPQNNISAQMTKYAADISSLVEEFQQRFRDFAAIEKEIALFSSPFSVDPDDAPYHLQLELIELQCDAEHHSRHQQLPLVNFYRQLDEGRFQAVRTFAKKMLSLFGSTYMCEKTFSVMNINKSRMRTRLSDSHLMHQNHCS
ncbi:general transcription factor II-I repeat domain-containing protein 2 [Nothobranchius furzeri]|uniref:general transcription factor II-I repeat domain-containing protein 2 n=1 Tax=Nothobranchius furzeri TaxID=105023 RepID=UPI003904B5C5